MPLILHLHPLSSYCHKVLFALYEKGIEFTPALVDLGNPAKKAVFLKLSPLGKMPVLEDSTKGLVLPESSVILEYLDQQYPGPLKLFPADPAKCLEARLWDRILDTSLHAGMQKIVGDLLRLEKDRDPYGVKEAKDLMRTAYDMLEKQLAGKKWILGDDLSVADCAAFPPLFYSQAIEPFAATHSNLNAYFERLLERPSVKRFLKEAKPVMKYFPLAKGIPARFQE